jgi:hypothetical protein
MNSTRTAGFDAARLYRVPVPRYAASWLVVLLAVLVFLTAAALALIVMVPVAIVVLVLFTIAAARAASARLLRRPDPEGRRNVRVIGLRNG